MKQFNKTLLVAALMVAAGSANANISVNNGNSELFMSVYDSSSKNTYSLNTGLTIDAFIAAAMDVNYTYTYDLSSDNVWVSSFLGAAGFNAATTVYALAVASNINPDVLLTSSAAGGLALADNDQVVNTFVDNIKSQAGMINPIGISKVVNDGGVANTGQFNQFDTVFGNQTGAQVAGAYGSTLAFFHETNVYDAVLDSPVPVIEAFAGSWTLAGNTLSFAAPAPAPVPLPAAVWLFGAGLMGMLHLNRRKSMAV